MDTNAILEARRRRKTNSHRDLTISTESIDEVLENHVDYKGPRLLQQNNMLAVALIVSGVTLLYTYFRPPHRLLTHQDGEAAGKRNLIRVALVSVGAGGLIYGLLHMYKRHCSAKQS